MDAPPQPADEPDRLAELRDYGLLDTEPEEAFDRLTRLVAQVLDVPIALVSLVDDDRQWFKSRIGLDATETGRDISFCGHAILGDDVFEVTDAVADRRFTDNPLVTGDPHIRFYAGAPLRTPQGHRIGTLCAIDRAPRQLDSRQRQVLADLAEVVMDEIRLRQMVDHLAARQVEVTEARDIALRADAAKSRLLARVSHELRTPVHAILGLTELAMGLGIDDEARELLGTVVESADLLAGLIDDLLQLAHAVDDRAAVRVEEAVVGDLVQVVCEMVRPLAASKGVTVRSHVSSALADPIRLARQPVQQVLINLASNAVKFTDAGHVEISARRGAEGLILAVSDTGPGIDPADVDRLMLAFERGPNETADGAGLGLAIVASVVERLNGTVSVAANEPHGTIATVVLPVDV